MALNFGCILVLEVLTLVGGRLCAGGPRALHFCMGGMGFNSLKAQDDDWDILEHKVKICNSTSGCSDSSFLKMAIGTLSTLKPAESTLQSEFLTIAQPQGAHCDMPYNEKMDDIEDDGC